MFFPKYLLSHSFILLIGKKKNTPLCLSCLQWFWQIHRLGNFTCKCVDMGAMAPSCDTLWRLRPEFSLSVRAPGKQYRRIAGLNSWMRFQATKSSAHMLGSRMEDAYLFLRPFKLSPARGIVCMPQLLCIKILP